MLALIILIFGFVSRLVVHLPNFSPVYGLALFGGVYLKGRQPIWVPVSLMAASDLVLGFYPGMVFTWAGILMISLIGVVLKSHKNWTNMLTAGLFSSLVFFVISNFGSFLSIYPHTWAGLKACYTLAIPFYRSTLVSTLAYSLVLFSIGELVIVRRETHSISFKESAV